MKPQYHRHSCPNCGHRVSWSRLHLRAWIWARWRCESCSSELRFDSGRRWLYAGLSALWFIFLVALVRQYVDLWVCGVLVFVGVIAISRLERIRLVRESHHTADLYARPKDT